MKYSLALVFAIALSSCTSKKVDENKSLILPVSVVSIDSLSINDNWNVVYRVKIVSPLPESLFVARPEIQTIKGDTVTYYMKFATLVSDSTKTLVGKYESYSTGNSSFMEHSSKLIRLRFWRDSVSTVDTVIQFK